MPDNLPLLIGDLRKRGARRVALQFPEGLKRRAPEMALRLREAGFEVIVSGDPCYGACDLPLPAMALADVLVHVGHAPVDDRPGVIYDLHPTDFDVGVLAKALPLLPHGRVGLVTTSQHLHLLDKMAEFLEEKEINAVIAGGTGRAPYPGQVLGCSFSGARSTGCDAILYVGTGLFHPEGIQLVTGARVIALDPFLGTATEVSADRLKRRRFALIEKARGAERIGILVSTKSGQQRLALARRLAGLSEKAVLVALCEVSPGELLNLGFDCYVNTACPRLAYDDQVRFPVPVLSPPEFEILCGARAWEDFTIDEWDRP
ncbi:MAG TPA: diphthamide biosynthesis enzyme Dph2 [Methanomicrobiales archaeon]|nr:diphthamide biosynthesis enzyme Dph2 [Methanomicrobiales archaeon]